MPAAAAAAGSSVPDPMAAVDEVAAPEAAGTPAFAHFSGTLAPGEEIVPTYQLFGTQDKATNLSLAVAPNAGTGSGVPGGDGSRRGLRFSAAKRRQGTLWTGTTLRPGTNAFTLKNPAGSSATLAFDLWLYDAGGVPFTAAGLSRACPTRGNPRCSSASQQAGSTPLISV